MDVLQNRIEDLWNGKSNDQSCIHEAMRKLNSGELRVAQKINGIWKIRDCLKKRKATLKKNKHWSKDCQYIIIIGA
jgi:hypothetical protein